MEYVHLYNSCSGIICLEVEVSLYIVHFISKNFYIIIIWNIFAKETSK